MANKSSKKKYKPKFDAEANKLKMDGIFKKIEDGINELWNTDKYKQYLKTMSKFHRYSRNNALLIEKQMPSFSRVASYSTWNRLGRQVIKGSVAIQILKPSPYKVNVEVDVIDPIKNTPVLKNGKIVTENVEMQKMAFTYDNVFDLSQTMGRELPTIVERLIGTGKEFDMMYDAISKVSPYKIVLEDTGRSGGYFKFAQKDIYGNPHEAMIAINQNLDKRHQVKTLIHELTHAEVHADGEGSKVEGISRSVQEVQAESVAFIVCEHFGIDSSDYSFGYISGWASDKELPELKNSLDIIKDKANNLITRIENELERSLEKYREIQVEVLDSNTLMPISDTWFEKGVTMPVYDFVSVCNNLCETLEFKDTVKLNNELKIKIYIPEYDVINTTIEIGKDGKDELYEKINIEYDIDLYKLESTYNQIKMDYVYYKVENSTFEHLTDGVYCEKDFENITKLEAKSSGYIGGKGNVMVHYKNDNGVHSPTNFINIDLSKDLNVQLNAKLSKFSEKQTMYYKSELSNILGDSMNIKNLNDLSNQSIKILGRSALMCQPTTIDKIRDITNKTIKELKKPLLINESAKGENKFLSAEQEKDINKNINEHEEAIKELDKLQKIEIKQLNNQIESMER